MTDFHALPYGALINRVRALVDIRWGTYHDLSFTLRHTTGELPPPSGWRALPLRRAAAEMFQRVCPSARARPLARRPTTSTHA